MTTADAVASVIINLFSSRLYDGKLTICERIRLWSFRRKISKWTHQYIIDHDGSVLTTGEFENFLQYHHLIEKIFEQVMLAENNASKEEFIGNQINIFHDYQNQQGINSFDSDDILKGFIEHFFDEINAFYVKGLSPNEKYIVANAKRNNHQVIDAINAANKEYQEGCVGIKELLQSKPELTDSGLVWSIFQRLSSLALNGRINDILQIFPLIKGKSKDLELSITFLLYLFSGDESFSCDFSRVQGSIIDERIYNHICRIAIYVYKWRNDKANLGKVTNRNPDLDQIVRALLDGKQDEFYTIEKSNQDGMTYYKYQVKNSYPNEIWIVKRICLLNMLQQPVFNASDIAIPLIEHPDNIIDRIVILEQRISKEYNKVGGNKELAEKLYKEACELEGKSENLAKDLKVKIYEMLLQSSLLLSEQEAEKVAKAIPEDLEGTKNIDFLLLQVKLKTGTVEFDDLINTCMKYGEYWLFNNYLAENVDSKPLEMKVLIERYKFVIEVDAAVFLIYVQLINNLDGQDAALRLFVDYETKYGDVLEYWIARLRIKYIGEEMDTAIARYKVGELKNIFANGILGWVQLLVRHERYNEALESIKRQEVIGNITTEFQRFKATALFNTNHEIEALSVYTKLFDEGIHSEDIIYYILMLSLRNRRPVPNKVLSYAKQSEKTQILMAVASIYIVENNIEDALEINMKAMLRTTDNPSDVFNQYIRIETLQDHTDETIVNGIDLDTVTRMQDNTNNTERVYAIHSIAYLPEEPYIWENTIHIYKETAIKLGLLRKKVGDVIEVDAHLYQIKEILPLRTYFFRLSMNKVVENGQAQILTIPVAENKALDIDTFEKEIKAILGENKNEFTWLEQYKDLGKIPVTFYFGKRFVRVTYFQFVAGILMDKTIMYRERYNLLDQKPESYIFSYAAFVTLYKLGWNCLGEKDNYLIPAALKRIIDEETEEVIRDNNREHVSFMGVNNDKLYFVETTEAEKTQFMQEAVKFKSYSENYSILDNNTDLHLEGEYLANVKKVLGIADYDALVIAKITGRTLVSAEVMVSGICYAQEIGVSTVGIADFLAYEASDVDELLSYIRIMMEYKFIIPFTVNTIKRISDFFEAGGAEERKRIIDQLCSILQMPIADEAYRAVMLTHVQACIIYLRDRLDKFNQVENCLLDSWLLYAGKKVVVSLNENSEIGIQFIDENEQLNEDVT